MARESRKPFLLRIDPALWSELEAWAADELRSVNGQIEFLLKQAVHRRRPRLQTPSPPASTPDSPRPPEPPA